MVEKSVCTAQMMDTTGLQLSMCTFEEIEEAGSTSRRNSRTLPTFFSIYMLKDGVVVKDRTLMSDQIYDRCPSISLWIPSRLLHLVYEKYKRFRVDFQRLYCHAKPNMYPVFAYDTWSDRSGILFEFRSVRLRCTPYRRGIQYCGTGNKSGKWTMGNHFRP